MIFVFNPRHFNESMCPTTHYISRPLRSMGVKVKHFISPPGLSSDLIESNIFEAVKDSKPEYLFFSSVNPSTNFPFSWAFIKRLKQILPSSKFVFLWWDTCCPDFFGQSLSGSEELVDLNIFVDNPLLSGLSQSQILNSNVRYYPLNYPIGTFVPGLTHKYKFTFVGQVTGKRAYRKPFLEAAASLKSISYHISVFPREKQTSLQDYISVQQSSMSTINFCRSVGINQLKGRAWEALHSRSLLFEEYGSPLDQLFVPGLDYESFASPEELRDKLKFYSSTTKGLRLASSQSLKAYEKLCSKYNSYNVLEDVFRFFG